MHRARYEPCRNACRANQMNHPGVKAGPFEIRPAADLSEMIAESEQRRVKTQSP